LSFAPDRNVSLTTKLRSPPRSKTKIGFHEVPTLAPHTLVAGPAVR